MRERVLCLALLAAVLIGTCKALPLKTDEVEARKYVDKVSVEMYEYLDKLSHDAFYADDNIESAIEAFKQILKTIQYIGGIVNGTDSFDYQHFKDKELKYIFGILKKSSNAAAVGDERFLNMLGEVLSLEETASEKNIDGYSDKTKQLAYYPDIQKIIETSKDAEELKYYWNAWRVKDVADTKKHLSAWIDGFRETAKINELSPLEYWLDGFDITKMEQALDKIKPIYDQLHAFVRKQLVKKYGEKACNPSGPIPDHLFEQVLAQAWTAESIIDELYPLKDLPPYDSILEKNHYDALKLYKTADKFYQSLGFEPIPDKYWDTQIKINPDEDTGDCKATLFDTTSNVYMKYCHKVDFRTFLQAHGYLGQMYYAREKKDLPAYYFSSENLEYPIGESVILSASAPKHLKAIGMVTDFKFTDDVLMNRLLRMGIHTLLNVPVYFVQTKVMADLFADTVKLDGLNKHYWKLMEKYVGVEPPLDRAADYFDFPPKFYIDLNENAKALKFNTEIMGYQFYQKFCEISGQFPKEQLQLCDFYDNKSVGDAMKKMMKLGSSKPIEEVVQVLLPGDSSINSASLLEYFSPMKTWLSEKNTEAKLKVGWTPTDKKIV